MASVTNKPALQVIRQLISEIKKSSTQKKIQDSLVMQYVLSESRKYKTTAEQTCKAKEEMEFVANTYLCYLQSKKKHQALTSQYGGRGERTVSDTANLVGFKLPHDPK